MKFKNLCEIFFFFSQTLRLDITKNKTEPIVISLYDSKIDFHFIKREREREKKSILYSIKNFLIIFHYLIISILWINLDFFSEIFQIDKI